MSDITVNSAAVVASANAIIERSYNFGAAIGAGELVYLDSNSRWQKMDANAAATGNGLSDKRGIALCNGANGQPASVALSDTDFTPGATLTNGASYWGSPNAGALAPVADVTSGNYATFVMVAKSTTKAHLRPVAAGATV